MVIKTKPITADPTVPYCVKYGPRAGQRSAGNVNTLVDFSFLRPREELDLKKLQDLTPEWVEEMKATLNKFRSMR